MDDPSATAAGGTQARQITGEGSGVKGAVPASAVPEGTRGRHIGVQVLVWGTTVLAVLAIFAVWANRQMLNPTNWSNNTSPKLLQNAAIHEATANYLVDQLYANVDLEAELKTNLPTELAPLAGPIAGGGVRSLATEAAKGALANARVQEFWKKANYLADQTFVTFVNGGKGAVKVKGGEVTLDLASIVANITNRLGLPNVSSKLRPSVANLKVLKSNQIEAVQKIGRALKGLALPLTIIVPLLYALAIALAGGFRRRTLVLVGIAIVTAGIIGFVGRSLLVSGVTNSLVKTEAVKPAAHAVLSIGTSVLSEIAGAFVVVGATLVAAAWFAGPARLAARGRRAIAPFLRERPEWTYGIVAGIMLLIFIWQPIAATGKPAGIIVFLALAFVGTYVLRRQTAEEFPAEVHAPQPS
jgi:hypothetical protein